jgi:hypothetical protein
MPVITIPFSHSALHKDAFRPPDPPFAGTLTELPVVICWD